MQTFTSASRCSDCQQTIVFVEDLKTRRMVPYTALAIGNGEYAATEPHNGKCPVKVRKRIEEHCIGCQLDAGRPILSIWSLVGYMRCGKHDVPEMTFQRGGRTYTYDRESLRELYKDALKRRKRLKKMSERPGSRPGMEAFAEDHRPAS